MRAGHEGLTELVHLGAAVVDVELGAHLGAGRAQDAGERIADGCPAGVPEMEWAGRVGADELEVDAMACACVVRAVGRTGRTISAARAPWAAAADPDIEEAGSSHLHRRDVVAAGEAVGEQRRRIRAG